jgi:pimeloyl-ACP methyl ester carboxylesterase
MVYTDPTKRNARKVFLLDYFHPHIPLGALKSVQVPAFIIAGDRDVIVAEHTLVIYRALPKAWLWIVPNSSHSTLIDHSAEFNRKVAEFFEK